MTGAFSRCVRALAGGYWLLLLAVGAVPALAASDGDVLPELVRHDAAVGRFTQQRRLPELERPIESSGRFAYADERGLLWQVREPVASNLVIDADGVFRDGERVRDSQALAAIRPLFAGLFGGDLEGLERDFTVSRTDVDSGWRLVLEPRDAGLARALERLVIAGDAEPTRLVIESADGGRTELHFHDIAHPDTLDEDLLRAFDRAR